jgi:hypothetical protein
MKGEQKFEMLQCLGTKRSKVWVTKVGMSIQNIQPCISLAAFEGYTAYPAEAPGLIEGFEEN